MRVAILTYNVQPGDAIGNQVAEKLAFFLESGADLRIFVDTGQEIHPSLRPYCRHLDSTRPEGEGWNYLVSSDLILVEYGHYYPLLGVLPMLAGGKARIVLDYHGVTPSELWGAHNQEALAGGARQRGLVWCADAALAHSRFTRQELLDQTDFPSERAFSLGYVVNREFWSPGPPRQDLRERLGIGTAALALFVGRLAPNKRVPLLVEAVARLKHLRPAVHAAIVGATNDLYQEEARQCRERALALGIGERVHILGHLPAEELRDAYRSADVFVMPSRHEGFCIPVIEAMACGVPVVAARAAALPETVSGAGLTFAAEDAADLERQLLRILPPGTIVCPPEPHGSSPVGLDRCSAPVRVAVVSYRHGTDFAGGAETSLRACALALSQAGHHVEVFTTCANTASNWTNHHPEGTVADTGIPVHRFRIDPHDRARFQESLQTLLQQGDAVTPEAEEEFLGHSIHSGRLLEALRQRASCFDAVLAGPYGLGLTRDVAREFPKKTILLPCYHDEPYARFKTWRESYGQVGGVLYHSPEEQDLAERKLGLNHPGGKCLGTYFDTGALGDPRRGRAAAGTDKPYLVYCGRYHPQKGLPVLLESARAYSREHPDRFMFVFMGEGSVAIPRAPWVRDLGFVEESVKRDVLAGASALVQLSQNEALSLVTLEAWAQGVPVIANRLCKVLAGHLRRGGGGKAVDGSAALFAVWEDLWQHPENWQSLGRQGQEYVRKNYGTRSAFTDILVQTVHDVQLSLAKRMRLRGLERAARFDRPQWRKRFAEIVEHILDAPPQPVEERAEVLPRVDTRTVTAGLEAVLVPVRVLNQGTHALLAEGPARFVLSSRVVDEAGREASNSLAETPLPSLLMPGKALAAAVPVSVPQRPGVYQVFFQAERTGTSAPTLELASAVSGSERAPTDFRRLEDGGSLKATGNGSSATLADPAGARASLRLIVQEGGQAADPVRCLSMLDVVQTALVEANRLQRLPCDYSDVTEGWFAGWKRWIKQKLLGNFKRAYVDVLSRQQSAFNQQVLAALNELADCCATLDHARTINKERVHDVAATVEMDSRGKMTRHDDTMTR